MRRTSTLFRLKQTESMRGIGLFLCGSKTMHF